MATTDGGPAFPIAHNTENYPQCPKGMSLRDWFAGQAVAGFIQDQQNLRILNEAVKKHNNGVGIDEAITLEGWIADGCYRLADAMLAAREKQS
jgi:hypothetical protein